jgi:prephenate dehydratase
MPTPRVAIQGERGAFSEVAARALVSAEISPLPCESFEQVFDSVESGRGKFGVIPIENSLIGSIHRNYDLLLERSLQIVGESELRIVHCLLAPRGTGLKRIRKVYSHPVALDQCRRFFADHPQIEPVSYYDTAGAAKMLAEQKPAESAAIAGPLAAELYDLKIVRRSIEDEKSNHTRFLLLARRPRRFSGTAKTSIVFSFKNQPGGLFKALSVFALRDIDLTKIESRPVRHATWQYYFYLDFVGSVADPNVRRALDHLGELTSFLKVLGSYPLSILLK